MEEIGLGFPRDFWELPRVTRRDPSTITTHDDDDRSIEDADYHAFWKSSPVLVILYKH